MGESCPHRNAEARDKPSTVTRSEQTQFSIVPGSKASSMKVLDPPSTTSQGSLRACPEDSPAHDGWPNSAATMAVARSGARTSSATPRASMVIAKEKNAQQRCSAATS